MTAALEIAGFAINLLAVLVEIVTTGTTPPLRALGDAISAPPAVEARTLGPASDALRAPEVGQP
mgnify:CR=1 FL=1